MIPDRIEWAVDQLAVRSGDHILQIRCGAGHAVALVCSRLTRGTMTAIDRSALNVSRARKRNHACIEAGLARIEQLTIADAPEILAERSFNKVLAINVNTLWTTPGPAFSALRRLVRPRGRIFLVYERPTAATLRGIRQSLPHLAEDNGFAVETVNVTALSQSHGMCLIARPRGRSARTTHG